jgi:hypothetical protein
MKPKVRAPADLVHVGILGEIDGRDVADRSNTRVPEVDRQGHPESVMGLDRELVALRHLDRTPHPDEALGRGLLLEARRLDQEHERTRAAVHDREFRRIEVHVHIVDAQPGQRGHQVLTVQTFASPSPSRWRAAVSVTSCARRDRRGIGQVRAVEDDTRLGHSRRSTSFTLCPGVQPHARGADDRLQVPCATWVAVVE